MKLTKEYPKGYKEIIEKEEIMDKELESRTYDELEELKNE